MTPKTHLFLHGKGGVGKTYLASHIAQHLVRKGATPVVYDGDHICRSLSRFTGLTAQPITLIDRRGALDIELMEYLAHCMEGSRDDFVIDTSTAAFLQLCTYLKKVDLAAALGRNGRQFVIHFIIAGGGQQDPSLAHFQTLMDSIQEGTKVVVWLNDYYGSVMGPQGEFETFKLYLEHRGRIGALIRMPPAHRSDLFRQDENGMLSRQMTYQQAQNASDLHFMQKLRLGKIQAGMAELLSPIV
jgi:hypothetical protein